MGNNVNVIEIINEKLIKSIEENERLPWQKPWKEGFTLAINRVSNKPYNIVNQILLDKPGEWATFNQWKNLGGKVKAKEKGSVILSWAKKLYRVKTDKVDSNGDPVYEKRQYVVPRYYTVFHISQIEGVKPLEIYQIDMKGNMVIGDIQDAIDYYISENKIKLISGEQACFMPQINSIMIPPREAFSTKEAYYATLIHEIAHSTGTKDRLDRTFGKEFGDDEYSFEELVAEISSCYILGMYKISTEDTFNNSKSYINGWISRLKEKPEMFIRASKEAGYVVDYFIEFDYSGKFTYDDDGIRELLKKDLSYYGSSVQEWEIRLSTLYKEETNKKKRIDYLKQEFGIGGHSSPMDKHEYGLRGSMHDAKGVELEWKDINGDHRKLFSWKHVDDIYMEIFGNKVA